MDDGSLYDVVDGSKIYKVVALVFNYDLPIVLAVSRDASEMSGGIGGRKSKTADFGAVFDQDFVWVTPF